MLSPTDKRCILKEFLQLRDMVKCVAITAINAVQKLQQTAFNLCWMWMGARKAPPTSPYDAGQWQGTVRRWRTSRHHQQSSWLPCSSAWLAVSSAPLVFVRVCVCVSQRLSTLPDWRILLTIFFPDDFFFGGARIGSANGEACFATDGEETTGCLCLLPGLKLLWCRRLANELTGNVFRKLASLLASRLAKSDRDTHCSGSENSH